MQLQRSNPIIISYQLLSNFILSFQTSFLASTYSHLDWGSVLFVTNDFETITQYYNFGQDKVCYDVFNAFFIQRTIQLVDTFGVISHCPLISCVLNLNELDNPWSIQLSPGRERERKRERGNAKIHIPVHFI